MKVMCSPIPQNSDSFLQANSKSYKLFVYAMVSDNVGLSGYYVSPTLLVGDPFLNGELHRGDIYDVRNLVQPGIAMGKSDNDSL